jgi:hypothetical protein
MTETCLKSYAQLWHLLLIMNASNIDMKFHTDWRPCHKISTFYRRQGDIDVIVIDNRFLCLT